MSSPQVATRSIMSKALSAIGAALYRIGESLAETPVYFWIYIGVMIYITKAIAFKDVRKKKRVIGGRTVYLSAAEDGIAENVVDIDRITVSFADVGGLEEAKQTLTEHIVWPFKRPELFEGNTIRSHPKGVLLYGPPGTGKTLLARALAKELGCSFINVNSESIFSKWVGETEKNAAAIFSLAEKISPCVIFVDEIDSLLSMRNSAEVAPHLNAKTIFMTQWDGLEKKSGRMLVVGATNRRFTIDDAIRRRLPLQLEVPPPDRESRAKILRLNLQHDLKDNPNADELIDYVAGKTDKYSGSDLTELCKAAALMPLREIQGNVARHSPPLRRRHFDEALKRVRPRT
ncbi:hypothetical protein AGDE_12025 [Angomonas deanei]|nr:hypothetical protein AGDE_12025 [Angomonas deanei]|eukprot:EPY25090.1 hypothetical protein AGDE_12025 [Angomonas deanei]